MIISSDLWQLLLVLPQMILSGASAATCPRIMQFLGAAAPAACSAPDYAVRGGSSHSNGRCGRFVLATPSCSSVICETRPVRFRLSSLIPAFILYVSTDSAADLVNKVQNQLNHVLTHSLKPEHSGDCDQQANWPNRGIPLWDREKKYGADACELKEEEIVQKGQAGAAQAPAAKWKLTGEEPAPKRKTASKP